jgi:hypothetical protein
VNVTEIVHFLPAAIELPQVFVCAKFPLATMLVIASIVLPVLVKITFLAALVEPTTTLPKFRDVAESETVCADANAVSNRNAAAATQRMPLRFAGSLYLQRVSLCIVDTRGRTALQA